MEEVRGADIGVLFLSVVHQEPDAENLSPKNLLGTREGSSGVPDAEPAAAPDTGPGGSAYRSAVFGSCPESAEDTSIRANVSVIAAMSTVGSCIHWSWRPSITARTALARWSAGASARISP